MHRAPRLATHAGAIATIALTLVAVPLLSAGEALARDGSLELNDQEYFEQRGLSVLVFSNEYNGFFFDEKTAGKRLKPYVETYRKLADGLVEKNPYGVPMRPGGWAGNEGVISWAMTNYYVHEAYPEIMGPEYVLRGLTYILGNHPYSNTSFVSGVGARSKTVAYGSNRADYSFIAGGVVPGVLLLKPDLPENKDDWPFLWGENEYVIDICAEYILLANAVSRLLGS